jgi:ATP-dependent helicase/nuclease subunit A
MPGNRTSVRENSWYDLVKRGLANSDLAFQETPADDGVVKSYRRAEDLMPETDIGLDVAAVTHPSLPEWLHTPATSGQIIASHLLRPSDPAEDENHRVRTGESLQSHGRALQRGTLVHRLLQSLPEIATERRRDAALKYLARNADGWTDGDREALAEAVLALIGDSRFAAVFAPGSRPEVSIAGRLERPGGPPALVSGQIDRLAVSPGEVLIVDYKTNHAPPDIAAEAPRTYVNQLALYRAVLQKLYPQLPVRAALLWTERPELMEIPAPALDAQLATIIPGDVQA